jgi:GDP-4-dehydro-6-deoxy-D-mannose reductase
VPGRTVLVTGAAGFAGRHLLERLGSGETIAWTRAEPAPGGVPGALWQYVDLRDRTRVRDAIADIKPTHVYHLAGSTHVGQSWRQTADTLAANVLTTHHLFDALQRAGAPCRVLLSGSATVYAPSEEPLTEGHALAPTSPYAVSKLAQERLGARALAEDGLEIILTRPFNHTGPRQRPDFAAPGMARQIALIERGAIPPVIRVGNLDAKRDLTDVRDTVRAYTLLMDHGTPRTVYNVASGVARPIRAVLEGLIARSGLPVHVEVDPSLLRPNDVPVFVGSAERLRAATGWVPEVSFDRMLDDLLAYWRLQP